MPPYQYRVMNLGRNHFAVRRFSDNLCEEAQFIFDPQGDPELRETEKKIIAEANRWGNWQVI